MDSNVLYIFSETLPNWLMAGSAFAAFATFRWRKQDKQEEMERRETSTRDKVYAVWATATVGGTGERKWGVIVVNNLDTPATNVIVHCHGNSRTNKLSHMNIQPGQTFFESLGGGSHRPWGLPTSNISDIEYITSSKQHGTQNIRFSHGGRAYSRSLNAESEIL